MSSRASYAKNRRERVNDKFKEIKKRASGKSGEISQPIKSKIEMINKWKELEQQRIELEKEMNNFGYEIPTQPLIGKQQKPKSIRKALFDVN
ncbi:MAG: hypothetical protein LBM99_06270, partial [Bacillales bacterium]|nr:hypothetical protein [Bacillales bacterium]